MKITFYGAAGEVTGSNHLLEIAGKKILIDCGMFQGSQYNEARNGDNFGYDPKTVDAVILTHAHLDHTGRVPKLYKFGCKGNIYGTDGTIEIAWLVWDDTVNIMKYEYKKYTYPMIYDEQDAGMAKSKSVKIKYGKWFEPVPGVRARFLDAGHIFGSSFVEIEGDGKRIVFSGDIGNQDVPILKDTEPLSPVDALVIESTYGGRVHEPSKERYQMLEDAIITAMDRGGVLMIPAFSIERTQELLYILNRLVEYDKSIPRVPIFLDSPLSIRAIEVYKKHKEYYDKEASDIIGVGDDFFKFPGLTLTLDVEDSKKINAFKGKFIIIAGSGMMDGGRILHHAFRYLSDPKSTLLITGFCALGTRGRAIIEGAKTVEIYGNQVPVKCHVESIKALSAHGDRTKLTSWAAGAGKNLKNIFIVHGEQDSMKALAKDFKTIFPQAISETPKYGQTFEL